MHPFQEYQLCDTFYNTQNAKLDMGNFSVSNKYQVLHLDEFRESLKGGGDEDKNIPTFGYGVDSGK